MKLTELIAHVGDENVSVQNLAKNMAQFKKGKRDSTISFFTSHSNGQAIAKEAAGMKSDVVALVVWIPRDKLPEDMQ
jgi:hypothetical protein